MSFRCTESNFDKLRQNDDGMPTASSREQDKVEESVRVMYNYFCNKISIDPECPVLRKDDHIVFLKRGLINLPKGYHCLDSSRPWLCYWILHSLELLDEPLSDQILNDVAEFLGRCQSPTGGFGGGPGQLPHLAPTYAAVNALCIIGTETAYNIIDREKLYHFLRQRKNQDGSFSMHEGGEIDIRGAYCALSIASLTNIATDELFENTVEWIVRCQTYEGGFGGVPGMEAHGGYTFCAFAGLVILGKEHFCDVPVLMRWAAKRQMKYEGGFQGRTNKSVDGCYSFWQGGIFPLIHRFLVKQDSQTVDLEKWLFNQGALQEYILICCQYSSGGLIDKPGRTPDFYHTCYDLSGLSISQHAVGCGEEFVLGDPSNLLEPTHPLYNIGLDAASNALQYFRKLSRRYSR